MAVGIGGTFGDQAPRRPAVGAGRSALMRRAQARGGGERRRAAEAARRGMRRGPRGRLLKRVADTKLPGPVRSAFVEVVRQSRIVQQKFLQRQKLRNVGLGLVAIWIAWTFLLGDAGVPRMLWLRWHNARLAQQIEELTAQEALLQSEVKQLRGGGDALVEKVAREEHALVRDGEVLVRFYDPKHKPEGIGD